jgi:hypothetical protein
VNVRRVEGIETASGLETSNQWRPAPSALTASLRHRLEFERYVAAMCSLTLMLVLVVGTAVYAGLRRAFRAAAGAASGAYMAPYGSRHIRRKPAHISSRFSVRTLATQ